MKKLLLCFSIFIFSFFCEAQLKQGEFSIGGVNGNSIIQVGNEGYVISGVAAPTHVYVAKINAFGLLQWAKIIGGKYENFGNSVVQTRDGGFATVGSTTSYGAGGEDVYIVKLDSSGNFRWAKTIGGTNNDMGYSIVQANDGGLIIAGSTLSFDTVGYDAYVIKLDSAGNLLWTKTIGGAGFEIAYSIIKTKEGGYAFTGTTKYGYGAYSNIYVVKLDSTGNLEWTKTVGGSDDDEGNSMVQTNDGGYAIAGLTESFGAGDYDFYVIKLDSIGNLQWTRTIGGTNADVAYSIVQTKDMGYLILGWTESFASGNQSAYLVKLDSAGGFLWSKVIGGSNHTRGMNLIKTNNDGYAFAGDVSVKFLPEIAYLVIVDSSFNSCSSIDSGSIVGSGGFVSSDGTITSIDSGREGSGATVSEGGNIIEFCSEYTSVNNIQAKTTNPKIFPNPCSNILYLDFQTQPTLSSIQISDITGRVLLTYDLLLTTYPLSLNVSSLNPGMYFIRINSISGTEVKKFIKE